MKKQTEKTEKTEKKGVVTMKTLKAWLEQTQRILEDIELTKTEEVQVITEFKNNVKKRFIESKF